MVVVSDFRRLKAYIARTPLFFIGTIICLAIAFTLGYIQFKALWPDRLMIGYVTLL
ncbi:hypothetical protein AAVH_09078 [Aphelenchoides avenae]|nr:hypothetical protein AAVH_09078 [Aphelenchus avenae]